MPFSTANSGKAGGHTKIAGFTLLEMAIVLTIIGLLTGVVLVGRTLIRQSQINSAMIDAQRYISAAISFRQKYGALPGDMPNATSYWGSMSTCPPTPGSASPGGTLTCNGDGNTLVYMATAVAPYNTVTNEAESLYFWQHLANAQLIQGNYTGIAGSHTYYSHVAGVNSPAGRLPALGFAITYVGFFTGAALYYPGNYGHIFILGANSSTLPYNPIMTTQEAQGFDSKYDDGLPGTGSVTTIKPGTYNVDEYCATTLVASTAVYNTSGANSSGLQCPLFITTGF